MGLLGSLKWKGKKDPDLPVGPADGSTELEMKYDQIKHIPPAKKRQYVLNEARFFYFSFYRPSQPYFLKIEK